MVVPVSLTLASVVCQNVLQNAVVRVLTKHITNPIPMVLYMTDWDPSVSHGASSRNLGTITF